MSDFSVHQLEQAIETQVSRESSADEKRAAIAFCDAVQTSADGWQRCLEFLFRTDSVQVKFFCLSTLETFVLRRYTQTDADTLAQLRQGLVAWLVEHVPNSAEDSGESAHTHTYRFVCLSQILHCHSIFCVSFYVSLHFLGFADAHLGVRRNAQQSKTSLHRCWCSSFGSSIRKVGQIFSLSCFDC